MDTKAQQIDDRLIQLQREILEVVQIGPGSTFMSRLDAIIAKARLDILKIESQD